MIELGNPQSLIVKQIPGTTHSSIKIAAASLVFILMLFLSAGRVDEVQIALPIQNDAVPVYSQIPGEDEIDYQEFMNSYENKIMLSSTIQKLPPELRKIIELSYYQDLNQREISEKMNMSQMQVSRRLKKALSRMYELIKNNGD